MATEPSDVLLAVFGAGASHGCLPLDFGPEVRIAAPRPGLNTEFLGRVLPPLTQDLVQPNEFSATLLGKYEAALPVVDAVRAALTAEGAASPTVSLERALADYQSLAAKDPQVERHLAAFRFYLRDLLWVCSDYMTSPSLGSGTTNHLTLIRKLHTWAAGSGAHVCLTSFNYDTVLETACRRVWDLDERSLDQYVTYTPMSVLKPHGSVLWQWPLQADRVRGTLHDAALHSIRAAIDASADINRLHCVSYQTDTTHTSARTLTIPALALPMDGKSELIWPPEQQAHFDGVQGRVSKLLVVGWRAAEGHFLERMERLTAGAKAVIVTGGPSAEDEADQIEDRLTPGVLDNTTTLRIVTDGFAGLMRSDSVDWLLAD